MKTTLIWPCKSITSDRKQKTFQKYFTQDAQKRPISLSFSPFEGGFKGFDLLLCYSRIYSHSKNKLWSATIGYNKSRIKVYICRYTDRKLITKMNTVFFLLFFKERKKKHFCLPFLFTISKTKRLSTWILLLKTKFFYI